MNGEESLSAQKFALPICQTIFKLEKRGHRIVDRWAQYWRRASSLLANFIEHKRSFQTLIENLEYGWELDQTMTKSFI